MNKNALIAIVVIVVLLLVVVILWGKPSQLSKQTPLPASPTQTTSADTSGASIDKDLQNLDLGNLNQEFKTVDSDINSL